ncbi:MAG: hypothetical protein QXJ22_04860 [Ignisphaera sp.]|uniref:DUF3782 domain-containing protein n=1 Tax=Ignisphaera aggregans TaxID=334771 RepID=A0A7J3JQG9_9CREN
MATLSSDEKVRFLKALEEDAEFRYAVAGLLGLDTVISELRNLRSDFLLYIKEQEKRWEENNRRWEENSRRWEENDRKWEENFKRWEENNKRWEENNRRWEEAYKRFEAIELELKKLREDFLEFVKLEEKRWDEANRRFSRIEMELGALSETVYSRYVLEDLREEISVRGEKIVSKQRNADFDGVEVDLFIETDRAAYVIEVKTKPSIEDIGVVLVKADIVQQRVGKPVVPIVTGVMIGREVESYAKSKGVAIYRY